MPDIDDCVTEVARHMVEMLSTQDTQRYVSERYRASLPTFNPQAVLLHLRACQTAFPRLKAQTVQAGEETLYKLKTGPGTAPQYFVVRDAAVQRVKRPT
jgi:hypothetical protein